VHVTYPKGHPKNAFSDKEVEAKFVRLVEPLLGEKRCNVFFDWAWRLEEVEEAVLLEVFVASVRKAKASAASAKKVRAPT